MFHDSIVEEIHKHREELFQQFGNDPEALVLYLQERERRSGKRVEPPPALPSDPSLQRIRYARR